MRRRVACPAFACTIPHLIGAELAARPERPFSVEHEPSSVSCEACRESLSARLDGEDDPVERATVDTHLAGCGQCRSWFDDAAVVTRLARTAPPIVSPGVDATVLDATPRRWRARTAHVLRWVLGGLGLIQFLLGVAQISALAEQSHVHAGQVASTGHLWHESAAWNLAVGAGFAWIAARRGNPSGITPTLTVFVVVLTLLSLDDLSAGRVEGAWLFSHGIVLAGYVIIVTLSRPTFDFGDPPSGRPDRPWLARFGRPEDAADHGDRPAFPHGPRPSAAPMTEHRETAA